MKKKKETEPKDEISENFSKEMFLQMLAKKKTGMPEGESTGIIVDTIQQQTVNSLVVLIVNIMSSKDPNNYTILNTFIRTLAKRLGEWDKVKELDEIFHKVQVTPKLAIPLPTLQYIFARDSLRQMSAAKTYHDNQVTLMDIIQALEISKRRMIDIFTDLAISHDVQPEGITRVDIDDNEGLPSL